MTYRKNRKSCAGSAIQSAAAVSAAIEALEPRQLLASVGSTPQGVVWGGSPRLIRQDVAFTQHPNLDGAGQAVAVIDTGID